MKREGVTPEQIGSNISDPDFLDAEGKFIPTASHGKSKKIGDIKISFLHDLKKGYVSISFLKSRDVVGAASYRLSDRWTEGGVSYLYRPNKGRLTIVTREQFIDNILRDYPEVGVWILWNI
jgi:hypothetical protein